MKPPKAKIHLVLSSLPLSENQPQSGLCGAEVKKAQICMMWDAVPMGKAISTELPLLACRKCLRDYRSENQHRYLYAIKENSNEAAT